jgi:hypothetical protein
MGSPVSDCQGTIKVTSPSTQTFNFAFNNGGKGGNPGSNRLRLHHGRCYGRAGNDRSWLQHCPFQEQTVLPLFVRTIPAVGGLVTATGEIKFEKTGATFASAPTVTLDLGAVGNLVLPATGTSSIDELR